MFFTRKTTLEQPICARSIRTEPSPLGLSSRHSIPDQVIGVHGEIMSIDKNLDLAQQTEQYNVYLFVKTLDALTAEKLTALPEMRELTTTEIWLDGQVTLAESMQQAFFLNYTAKRDLLKQHRGEPRVKARER